MLWLGLAGRLDAQASWTLRNQSAGPGDFLWSVTDGNFGAVAVGDISAEGTVLATNDNWSDAATINGRTVSDTEKDAAVIELATATAASGAFPLPEKSKDAALILTLVPGNYTIQVSGANDTTGLALVEAYDVPNN